MVSGGVTVQTKELMIIYLTVVVFIITPDIKSVSFNTIIKGVSVQTVTLP